MRYAIRIPSNDNPEQDIAAARLRRQPLPVSSGLVGYTQIVGQVGEVRSDLSPLGTVYVGRESWTARTRDGGIVGRDTRVRVVGQEGLTLIVEKVE